MTLDGLLTIEEAAELVRLAPSTLAEKCRRGQFPCVKLPHGRRVLISRADVEAYLAGCELEVRQLEGGGRLVQPVQRRRG